MYTEVKYCVVFWGTEEYEVYNAYNYMSIWLVFRTNLFCITV